MEYGHKTIIIVDDSLTNLNLARNALSEMYNVFTISSGRKLFSFLEKVTPDLILLDIEMPDMSGYEVIEKLKNNRQTAHIPVVFLTAATDPQSELKGLSLGAVDYLARPYSQQLLQKRIEINLLADLQRKKINTNSRDQEALADDKRKTIFELQNAILKTVADLVESRDCVTGGHVERTQTYLRILIDALMENGVYAEELSSWDIGLFIMASQLHDVGKISIRDNILLKPERLSVDEFDKMKWHVNYGMNIIMKIERSTRENTFLKHARITAGSHHEKWDGTGYFLGLKGEDIPLQGRLMSIVDVYDALTNDRPYNKALPHKEAIRVIGEGTGTQFDPRIGEIFIKYEKKFDHCSKLDFRSLYYSTGEVTGDIGNSVVSALTNIVDARDEAENAQTDKIQNCLKTFLEILLTDERYKDAVSQWDLEIFLLSAQLHDVGKIAINDELLNKTEKLTPEEFEKIKWHTNMGLNVLNQIKGSIDRRSLLSHAEALVGCHHERWDGSGYPLGLKGDAIPLQGRVMAIIDVYEALTSDRPQRHKKTHEEAVEIIRGYSGTHFDPELVEVFAGNENRFLKACSK